MESQNTNTNIDPTVTSDLVSHESGKKLLKLTISRVDASIFDGGVLSATVPGTEGEMTLMADHVALISALKAGIITIRLPDGTNATHDITSGTLEIRDSHATILI